jgi:hypothetical protein
MPTDALLAAADGGQLTTPESVQEWSSTLLGDARASNTLVRFHEQLLSVKDYGSIVKSGTLYPNFTPELAPVLQEEARLFFQEVAVNQNGGIGALLTSPVTYVNDQTAQYYGVTGSFGSTLTKVDLNPTQRAGFLTHIGFLSKYGSQTQSDPILRGVHISLDIMCSDLPAPPPDVPPLPATQPDQTNRERVELATSEDPCAGCHKTYINPLGFPLEHYDAVGAWRDTDNGKPVNAASSFELDGQVVNFNGPVELSQALAASPTVHRCYSRHWVEYMMGRKPAAEEAGVIDDLALVSTESGTLRGLLTAVTALETFRARPGDNL